MTVIHTTSWRIALGRTSEVIENLRTAREIHRRHGFGASAWRTIAAGADEANLWYLLMSAGPADHFAQMDALTADAEWQAFVTDHLDHAEAAAAQLSTGIWQTMTDLPDLIVLASGVSPRAQLISGYAPMTSAQRARFRGMALDALEIFDRHGLSVGFAEATAAGERTGAVSAVVGALSLVELGAGLERLETDADWLAYRQESAAHPDTPVLTTRSIRQEIV
jgi:hypothetical protein